MICDFPELLFHYSFKKGSTLSVSLSLSVTFDHLFGQLIALITFLAVALLYYFDFIFNVECLGRINPFELRLYDIDLSMIFYENVIQIFDLLNCGIIGNKRIHILKYQKCIYLYV